MRNAFLLLPCLFLLLLPCIGCAPDHESNVRQRAELFVGHLIGEDYDACAQMTDPAFIQKNGTDGAKLRYKLVVGVMKFGGVVPEQAHVDSVMLDSDAKNATVNFSVLVNGEWNAVSAQQRWARVDNEWFFVPQR